MNVFAENKNNVKNDMEMVTHYFYTHIVLNVDSSICIYVVFGFCAHMNMISNDVERQHEDL